jgi:predicted acylesterase/phospholipase RssA
MRLYQVTISTVISMKNLVIGPGAMGYFAYLGSIYNLQNAGMLDDLESISGSSAGAIVAYLLLIYKFDFKKIVKKSFSVNLNMYIKPDLASFFQTYGAISVKDILKKEVPDLKFKDFLPMKLYIPTFCVERSATVYFSTDTHPDMSALEAVAMSIAVPLMFSSEKLGGLHYIDGGIQESVPYTPFLGREDDTLILKLVYNEFYEINNISSYANCLMNAMLFRNRLMSKTFKNLLFIRLDDISVTNFTMPCLDKLRLFAHGYEETKKYILY